MLHTSKSNLYCWSSQLAQAPHFWQYDASHKQDVPVQLYNVMSRKAEVFHPRDKKLVKMFTCGSSIYRNPHIGNYRTFLYEDLLFKYLEYLKYKVKRVIVFTDVEDKGIEEANNNKAQLQQITEKGKRQFFKDIKLLNIHLPKQIPQSKDSVSGSVKMIQKLLKMKYAYWHNGDIYFDPKKKKDFGKLYRLDMKKWPKEHVHFSRDNYDGNHWFLGDFVLWHGYKAGDQIYWNTKIGKGRPAWHIQDPAIILKTLGTQVDINCGGIDNIYRHHDYNIALMESITNEPYANYYLLGEHLFVNGKKMAKSRGNIIYPNDLSKMKFAPEQIRLYLGLTKHYRKKMYFHYDRLKQSALTLQDCQRNIDLLLKKKSANIKSNEASSELIAKIETDFEYHMDNDLDAPKAFLAIQNNIKRLSKKFPLSTKEKNELRRVLARINKVVGVFKLK